MYWSADSTRSMDRNASTIRSKPLTTVSSRASCPLTRRGTANWIPSATVQAEDDGTVLSIVSSGLGMAIMPALSLTGAPPTTETTDLGAGRPTRSVGYVTTPELATTVAVRALIRELRALRPLLPLDRG